MLYTKDNVADFKSQTFAYLIVEEDDHVLNITLNRPEKKNAMNPMLMNELVYALSYAHHTPSVWVVVLQAKGDVFCAGADLKAFAGQSPDGANSSIPEPPAPPACIVPVPVVPPAPPAAAIPLSLEPIPPLPPAADA